MRYQLIALTCFLALTGEAYCQSLSGTVYGPQGHALPNAPIQAKNTATGAVFRTNSSASGRYALTNLPSGSYEVRANMPCCAYKAFVKDNVTVKNGESTQLEIKLEEGRSMDTYGDDPGTIGTLLRKRAVVPHQPVPRTRDGKPDFSGVWLIGEDLFAEHGAYRPRVVAVSVHGSAFLELDFELC